MSLVQLNVKWEKYNSTEKYPWKNTTETFLSYKNKRLLHAGEALGEFLLAIFFTLMRQECFTLGLSVSARHLLEQLA